NARESVVMLGNPSRILAVLIMWMATLSPGAASPATFQTLGYSTYPAGVNADGSVVVGSARAQAFRWTAATAGGDLGTLPGDTSSGAYAVSAEGSTVVGGSCMGTSDEGATCRAFRWTEATGMMSLGKLPGDSTSLALGVSADGSVVVGVSGGPVL